MKNFFTEVQTNAEPLWEGTRAVGLSDGWAGTARRSYPTGLLINVHFPSFYCQGIIN